MQLTGRNLLPKKSLQVKLIVWVGEVQREREKKIQRERERDTFKVYVSVLYLLALMGTSGPGCPRWPSTIHWFGWDNHVTFFFCFQDWMRRGWIFWHEKNRKREEKNGRNEFRSETKDMKRIGGWRQGNEIERIEIERKKKEREGRSGYTTKGNDSDYEGEQKNQKEEGRTMRGKQKWMRGRKGWRIMEMDGEEDLSGKEDEGMEEHGMEKGFLIFSSLSSALFLSLSLILFDSSSFLFSSSPLPASISSTHSYSSRFTSVQSEDKIVCVCKNIIWWLGK